MNGLPPYPPTPPDHPPSPATHTLSTTTPPPPLPHQPPLPPPHPRPLPPSFLSPPTPSPPPPTPSSPRPHPAPPGRKKKKKDPPALSPTPDLPRTSPPPPPSPRPATPSPTRFSPALFSSLASGFPPTGHPWPTSEASASCLSPAANKPAGLNSDAGLYSPRAPDNGDGTVKSNRANSNNQKAPHHQKHFRQFPAEKPPLAVRIKFSRTRKVFAGIGVLWIVIPEAANIEKTKPQSTP